MAIHLSSLSLEESLECDPDLFPPSQSSHHSPLTLIHASRPAPGIAKKLSSNDLYDKNSTFSRHPPPADIQEKRFVKVDAKRLYNASQQASVNGTFIVTPDFFIFEPTETVDSFTNQEDATPIDSTASSKARPSNANIPPHPAAVCIEFAKIKEIKTYAELSAIPSEILSQLKGIQLDIQQNLDSKPSDSQAQAQETIPTSSQIASPPEAIKMGESSHVEANQFAPEKEMYLCLIVNDITATMLYAISMKDMDVVLAGMLQWGVGNPKSEFDHLSSDFEELDLSLIDLPIISDSVKAAENNQNRQRAQSESKMVADALRELAEENYQPQLVNGTSDIFTDSMLLDLGRSFPSHFMGNNLRLIYKTSRDGFSLASIYRKMRDVDSASLLIIQDSNHKVFGALLSEKMRLSQYFYGKGETFVFHWDSTFKKYEWTGKNSFLLKGDTNYFSIGATSGHNAIWFEDNLKNGRSDCTDTFDNPVLCGGESSNFNIDCLEVWQMIS